MDTAAIAAGIEFRGAHHPAAAAIRTALAYATSASAPAGPPGPRVLDATPLGARLPEDALRALRGAADALIAAPVMSGVGSAVFLLAETDAARTAAAVRALAREAAPHWRLNAIRIGRSAADAARTALFALNTPSFTGQFLALDMPPQASIPVQADRPAAAARSPVTREVMIRDLVVPCRVGVRRHERDAPQRVRVNLKLVVEETILRDRLEDVVCYDEIVDHIRRIAAGGHVNLVETLAERIADGCFSDPRVRSARVAVEKLDVYSDATAAGVRIIRHRADSP